MAGKPVVYVVSTMPMVALAPNMVASSVNTTARVVWLLPATAYSVKFLAALESRTLMNIITARYAINRVLPIICMCWAP